MSETALSAVGPQMIAFRTIEEIEHFAKTISQSVFVPQAFRGKPGDVVAAVMYGLERGLSPMTSLQNVAVINGKPSIYGDMLLGLCMSDPSTESIEEADTDEIDETGLAWCEAKRKGRKKVRRTFSLKDAERAKLTEKTGPWHDYRSRMLMMRARSWCLRDAYADRLMGLQAREEAQDIIDVTPTVVSHTPPAAQASVVPSEPQASDEAELRREVMRAITSLLQAHFPHEQEDAYRRFIPNDALVVVRGAFGVEKWANLKAKSLEELRQGYTDLLVVLEPQESAENEIINPENDVQDFSGPGPDPSQHPQDDAQVSGEVDSSAENTEVSQEGTTHAGGQSEGQVGDNFGATDVYQPSAGFHTSDMHEAPDSGKYATPQQVGRLKLLAKQIGDEAYADVQDVIDHHPDGLPEDVYKVVRERLLIRQSEAKAKASPQGELR